NGVKEEYHNGEFGPDVIVDYIGAFIEANKDGPFLVYYPMMLPHSPFVPNPDSDDWNPKSKGAKRGSMDPNYFDDMVRYTDKMVGRIMQQVKDAGLTDNTYLFFTSDNGSLGNTVSQINGKQVRGGKGKTTNAGTHVPFVVVGPGVSAGQVNDGLVDFTDFLPTFCEISDSRIHEESTYNGHSLLSQLHGDDNHRREFIYCWYQIPSFMKKNFPGILDMSFARNQRYKLYRDGNFYDVDNDPMETQSLRPNEYDQELIRMHDRMAALIKKHDGFRTE
ncbi:MAG: sulfatase-like hydrolase/transferase, partial [Puniceicoccaceae bacterium]|nr:sulfatase-like hydrolase/transferase [Puniceicoccaceae bacterium]